MTRAETAWRRRFESRSVIGAAASRGSRRRWRRAESGLDGAVHVALVVAGSCARPQTADGRTRGRAGRECRIERGAEVGIAAAGPRIALPRDPMHLRRLARAAAQPAQSLARCRCRLRPRASSRSCRRWRGRRPAASPSRLSSVPRRCSHTAPIARFVPKARGRAGARHQRREKRRIGFGGRAVRQRRKRLPLRIGQLRRDRPLEEVRRRDGSDQVVGACDGRGCRPDPRWSRRRRVRPAATADDMLQLDFAWRLSASPRERSGRP